MGKGKSQKRPRALPVIHDLMALDKLAELSPLTDAQTRALTEACNFQNAQWI